MNEEIEVKAEETNTQPEDNGEKSEKLFTQAEVNKIVKDRLARARSQEDKSENAAVTEYAEQLKARESAVSCKEYLIENGYSTKYAELLDTSDVETFKKKVEEILTISNTGRRHTPRPHNTEDFGSDNSAEPFRKVVPHKPDKRYT